MKLSISNIAWTKENDEVMLSQLVKCGVQGLEIAPTRIFNDPYLQTEFDLHKKRQDIDCLGLKICSMQSLYFNYETPFFDSDEHTELAINFFRKILEFSSQMGISNVVFGSPKLRNVVKLEDENRAFKFFSIIAKLATEKDVQIALEPNPVIYQTNFLNTTNEAINYVKNINSPNLGINLDLGTIIYNQEDLVEILTRENLSIIKHVHISEPLLNPISIHNTVLHKQLIHLLSKLGYEKYISIEMKSGLEVKEILSIVSNIKEFMS